MKKGTKKTFIWQGKIEIAHCLSLLIGKFWLLSTLEAG